MRNFKTLGISYFWGWFKKFNCLKIQKSFKKVIKKRKSVRIQCKNIKLLKKIEITRKGKERKHSKTLLIKIFDTKVLIL